MNSIQGDTLDCKVKVRKYVLVSQPSRWRKKSDRVVVQSPMLQISKPILEVPVRRFNGEEQNSVCFIPKQDIERDTSSIYEKEQSQQSDSRGLMLTVLPCLTVLFIVNLHTVEETDFGSALRANTNSYGDIVPVINLRTFEKGDIRY
jgi:hypothetical protein